MGYYFPSSSGSVQTFADYIISKNGSTYVSVNASGSTISSSAAFHTVLNATINALTSGGKIFIKTGAYTVTSSILGGSKNNIEIELARKAVLTLSNNADTHMFYLDTVSNWWIHGGEIDGNEANQTTPGGAANTNSYGIYLLKCTNMKISDMLIHDFCRAGAKTEGSGGTYCVDTYIQGCYFYDNNWCGYLPDTYTQGAIVQGCRFTGGGEGGVAGGTTSPIKDITVDGCTQHDINGSNGPANYNIGIYFEVGTGIKIVNNHIWNCKCGILITSTGEEYNVIANNNIHDCTGTGENSCIICRSDKTTITGNVCNQADTFNYAIVVGSSTSNTGDYCVVANNSIFGSTNCHGILLARVVNCVVANNVIFVLGNAIVIDNSGNYNSIHGNRVVGSAMGLNINAAAITRTWVDSNDFDGCTDAAADSGTNTRYGSNVDHAGAIVIAGMP